MTEPTQSITTFHTHEEDNGAKFHFRKPTVGELDRFTSKLAKTPVSTALNFCEVLVGESSKAAWKTLVEDRPGTSSTVANAISEKMGFRQA